jgi:Stage II sporulation protein E (SpoIIE)
MHKPSSHLRKQHVVRDLSEQNRAMRRSLFAGMVFTLACGAALWAGLALYFGARYAAAIPLGYLFLTGCNFLLSRQPRFFSACAAAQVFLSIVLPFAFQSMLGGMAHSGMVMFWCYVPLAGALGFNKQSAARAWLLLVLVLNVIYAIEDPVFLADPAAVLERLPNAGTLLATNLGCVTAIIFSLALYFVHMQGRARKRLFQVREELEHSQKELREQAEDIAQGMATAARLQRALIPDLAPLSVFTSESGVSLRQKQAVGGTMYWVGEKCGLTVVVVFDCQGHGVGGSLLTVICCEVLNQVVLEQGIVMPNAIMTHVISRLHERMEAQSGSAPFDLELAVLTVDTEHKRLWAAEKGVALLLATQGQAYTLSGYCAALPNVVAKPWGSDLMLELNAPARLYFHTRGFTAQRSDRTEGPYHQDRLRAGLVQTAEQPFNEQFLHVMEAWGQWKGQGGQTRDALILGLELRPEYCSVERQSTAKRA